MENIQIIYPALAMFCLTVSMVMFLGISRFVAIHTGKVNIKFYRTYNEGTQPDRLHLLARHVQLHFEVPPIFYVGVILLYVTETVSPLALNFAWAFFVLRGVHSFIHLGPNNVSYRFFSFGASLMALFGMWVCLFMGILNLP